MYLKSIKVHNIENFLPLLYIFHTEVLNNFLTLLSIQFVSNTIMKWHPHILHGNL